MRTPGWAVVVMACAMLTFNLSAAQEPAAPAAAQHSPALREPDVPTSIRLKYAVLDSRGDFMPCRPTFFKNREAGVSSALQGFPEIANNPAVLEAIALHLNLNVSALGDDERVLIYCEYQKLNEIRLEPWGDKYRVVTAGDLPPKDPSLQGWTSVDPDGRVMSFGVQVLMPASSGPLRDIPPTQPPADQNIRIVRVDQPKLRYQALDRFPNPRNCGLRFEDLTQEIAAFQEIQRDTDAFSEIKRHLKIPSDTDLSDAQKRQVYLEYAKLQAIPFDLVVSKYQFRSGPYIGLIDSAGHASLLRSLPITGCP